MDTAFAASLDRMVPPEIGAMADHVRLAHANVQAVLAYGSCLRGVATTESLIDLYVLTSDYRDVSSNLLSQLGCRLAPPNVYYAECDFDGHRYRAKYAVLPIDLFARWMTASNPYFWARFSQPSVLLFSANDQARTSVVSAVNQAAQTMIAHGKSLTSSTDITVVCTEVFKATYATELRSESGSDRAAHVVNANETYYRSLAPILSSIQPVTANWPAKRMAGKLWSVVRLLKAAFTFTGGADYLVWKVERHSGHKISLTDWQRRHPIIAGLMLLPQLLKRGAVK